ncbi:MAG: sigma-70 family RNA polymerase sigma factor [Limisphaerales bacterium]
MPELDDQQLLAEFSGTNSEPAFATLVERYVNLVYSTALRFTGNSHHAEEITQAVFIILARKAGKLSTRVVLSSWLYQAARLTASNFLKSENRRQHREQEAFMQTILNEPDTNSWKQIAPLLDEAMGKLGETDRNAVVLSFFENKTAAEIAAKLKLTEAAAHKRVSRALEKLRKSLTKRGVNSTTAIIAGAISANSVQAAPVALAKSVTAVAIAKGAAASVSTLTLIKGALKIMAWTKMKTAIVTGAVIALAGISTISIMNYIHHLPPKQIGRMNLPTGDVKPMIAYSYDHSIFILASDGSLWSWGEERSGWPVLGYSNTNRKNSVSLRRIGQDNDWESIAVGDSQCLAIKSDGSLWGWGENLYYQLGDGTKTTRPTPVPSIPGNDWKQAATGSSSFGLKNDGTLWAWGSDWSGQLGIGKAMRYVTNAVQVGDSTNWIKVWGGGIQTVGLQSDGSLWFWGSLTGDGNDKKPFLVPTRVSPDTNWTDVCFGYFTMFALKSDGTLWTWGLKADIYNGEPDYSLDGSRAQLTPIQIGTENDWQSFSSAQGCFYLLLRKKDGSLWVLDASEHRTIKSANSYKPIAPRKINFQKDIAAYAAGGDNIGVILTPDGEVWTWGRVIGQHSPKDFWGANHQQLLPEYKIIDKPWQVSNIESSN